MKFLRKLLSAAAAAVFSFGMLAACPAPSASVSAANGSVYYYSGSKSAAEEYIASQLANYSQQINVRSYNLTYEDLETLLEDIILSRSDLFYIEPTFLYAKDSTGYIAAIRPSYYYTKDSLAERRKALEKAADSIISQIGSSWSDVRKALYVHDIIALDTTYDINGEIRSSYEVLAGKKGQCVCYAMAYKYIMDRLGIGCIIVMDEDINHSWNMVKIGSEWYHVDVTWDDTVPNFEGLVYHDYFLVSDSAIRSGRNPHTGTFTHSYSAPSASFDNMFWSSSATQILNYDSVSSYYIDNKNGTFNRFSWSTGKYSIIQKIGLGWSSDVDTGLYWLYNYSRIDRQGSYIYYNTPLSINVYDINTKKITALRKFSSKGTTAIYGLRIKNGEIYYNTAVSPTDKSYKTYKTALYSGSSDTSKTSSSTTTASSSSTASAAVPQGSTGTASSVPEKPSEIKYSVSSSDGSVTLIWNECRGASGYTVYRYDPSAGTAYLIGTTSSPYFTDSNAVYGSGCYLIRSYARSGGKIIYSDYTVAVIR